MEISIRLFRTYRPGTYFGIIAAVLFVTSVLFLLPVLVDYSRLLPGKRSMVPRSIGIGIGKWNTVA